jgi:hypothetical protein
MTGPETPSTLDSAHEVRVTLGLLTAIEADSAITQRLLSTELGIALGLANAYLKRCVRKGYVKIRQIRPNRCAYYLTPTGFAEKSRLTATYLQQSFLLFRLARIQYQDVLRTCEANNWRRVALFGSGDLAEIVRICAIERLITIVGVVTDHAQEGLPCVRDLREMDGVDAALITSLEDPQSVYDTALGQLSPERILHPAILNISTSRRSADGDFQT